jgi:hypothetical protein
VCGGCLQRPLDVQPKASNGCVRRRRTVTPSLLLSGRRGGRFGAKAGEDHMARQVGVPFPTQPAACEPRPPAPGLQALSGRDIAGVAVSRGAVSTGFKGFGGLLRG